MSNELNFDKLIIDRYTRVYGLDRTTGELLYVMEDVKDGSLANTEESSQIIGAAGVILSELKKNKAAVFSCNNAYLVFSAVAAQTGTKIINADATNFFEVPQYDIKEVTSNTEATLSKTPVAGTLKYIYKANSDGSRGTMYELGTEASATEFVLTGDEITLPTGAFSKEDKDRFIAVYRKKETVSKKVSNLSETSSMTCRNIAEVLCRDTCDNNKVYITAIEMPNASVEGNFNIDVADTPAAHAFSAKTLTDSCSVDKELWNWYIMNE